MIMKKMMLCYILCLIGTALFVNVWAAESETPSSNSAFLLPHKRVELGLFQPLRYGFSENIEFSTHPLLLFISPNLDVKWAHGAVGDFTLASRHGVTYPTPLLRMIAKEGIGGLISPEFEIPSIFSFQNELLASTTVLNDHLFTGKIGVNFALLSENLDERTTIDLPVVYTRTSVYYNDFGLRVGGDLQGPLFKKFDYLVDADIFYYPTAGKDVKMAFEHKGLFSWKKSSGFQVCFGYLLSYGQYPFGDQWHLLPLFDLMWAWSRK